MPERKDPAQEERAPDDRTPDDPAREERTPDDQTPDDQTPDDQAPEVKSPEDARERLRRAVLAPSRSQLVVAVLLALLGFAAVVQVRDNAADDVYAGLRENQLIEILDGLTGTAERARDEIERLEGTREQLRTRSSGRAIALAEAQQRLRALNILAGAVPVQGPGLRVTITPGTEQVSLSALLDVVQELRTAGAEAIEFNNEIRVVAESSFDSTTIGLELDGVLLKAPFVIEAIGDPHVMSTGLHLTGGPVETLEQEDGATVTMEELPSVKIESVRDPMRLPHATIDQDQ